MRSNKYAGIWAFFNVSRHRRIISILSVVLLFSVIFELSGQTQLYTVSGFVLDSTSTPSPSPTPAPSPTATPFGYKVSGYICDSSGKPITGQYKYYGDVTFNTASQSYNAPSNGMADSSGYYERYVSSGTYTVSVWPPYDSNYCCYQKSGFTVTSDIKYNFSLATGYKLSGYINDGQGNPVVGAGVLLNFNQPSVQTSGYFSDASGYYFLAAPAGSYTITVRQGFVNGNGQNAYTTYTENNFALNADTVKNITLTTTSTPSPTPLYSSAPTAMPTSSPNQIISPTVAPKPSTMPTPTPMPNVSSKQAAAISIFADASSASLGTSINLNGRLLGSDGNPLIGKYITLSYAVAESDFIVPIGSDITNSDGKFSIQWASAASGTFTLTTQWAGDNDYSLTSNSTTISFLPYQSQNIFMVESNSTVTALAFDSTNSKLGFSVTGPSGSTGYVKVTIAKSLCANPQNIKVFLDGNQLNYVINSNVDSWQLTFSYHHSTHQVSISLAEGTVSNTLLGINYSVLIGISIAIIVCLAILGLYKRKRLNSVHQKNQS